LATNPDAMQFNPAAILSLPNKSISSTYMNYFVGGNGGSMQLLLPRDKYYGYGVFVNYLNFGSIDRTEISSTNELLETGETFGAQNIILGASIARWMNNFVDLGVTGKVIYDQIDDKSAAAGLIDAGLIHHPANQKIKAGVSIRNLGTQFKYYTEDKYHERLPFVFAFGLAYHYNDNVLVTAAANKTSGQNFNASIGTEYKLTPYLDLRAGFKSNAGDWRTGGFWEWASGLSFGTGFNWNAYQIDYAVSSYGDLGFVNQVSLARNF